ncbi:phosphate-starvation-inducible PsiE family protein [Methylohalobius crimeensis]|uniref:phosphate-starvation-inducible PsiE family protein n=1 Tax=Methylohalobius crimeensis TaxID=244365 RepID=UPI0003B654BB|nr:phosphate-starvation-inducible PsiE family protein [Methylohalobius crimeensis]
MIRLSYISQARQSFSDQELDGLLTVSRANNGACGVTGILFYGNKMFLQTLEGSREAVEETFKRIKKDSRHVGVRVIEKVPIDTREFEDFGMAFKRLSDREFASLVEGKPATEEETVRGQQQILDTMSRHFQQEWTKRRRYEELPTEHEDPLIRVLHKTILGAVRVLAILMTGLIILSVFDVLWTLYQRLSKPPLFLLEVSDIFAVFGAFLAVLIAIEIFINITLYLRTDVIPVRLVVATALMAVSRKVIVLDFKIIDWPFVAATGVVVLALGITYWLLGRVDENTEEMEE